MENYGNCVKSSPRGVSFLVRIIVLLGTRPGLFGWFLFGFGLIFFWIFVIQSDITSLYYFRGKLETVSGVVTDCKKISSASSNEGRPIAPVYASYYTFKTDNGKEYRGVSYTKWHGYEIGKRYTVEYPHNNPSVSRLKGARRKRTEAWGALLTILPLSGLWMIISGARQGSKKNRFLRTGQCAEGILTDRYIGKKHHRLTFEFTAVDGKKCSLAVNVPLNRAPALEIGGKTPILYDPHNSSHASAIQLDNLSYYARVGEDGSIEAGNYIFAFIVLLFPVAALIGHGIYVYLKFFK